MPAVLYFRKKQMDNIKKYIEQNKERFLNELFNLLRIPSVSAQKDNKETMYRAATNVKDVFISSGCAQARVMDTEGWPVVYGEKIINPELPTVLVYGHYDVQPPEPLEEWTSHPFKPVIRDDKIYGRGADDDKGQLFMQIKAFEYMVKDNKLPCNVKFLVEGEEEISSPSLKKFCIENKKMLEADVILVSDTTMLSLAEPTITTGLRGIAYFELTITGPNRDLHSGLYGGVVNNPANVLATIIASLKDADGCILIPGFYDNVVELSEEERELLNRVSFNEVQFANNIKVKKLHVERGYTVLEGIGIRPTLDVNGIWGGYTGQGAKTIMPSRASAKISMRLVPNQDPEKIKNIFNSYLQKVVPDSVTYQLTPLHGGNPYVISYDTREMRSAVAAIEKVFGKRPLPVRSGGSIPVVADFEEVLGIKTVLMGFGLDTDAIHSPNENFPLQNFYKGIESIAWFYYYYNAD